jgi:tetratricopeptide (TPR) repeat protein
VNVSIRAILKMLLEVEPLPCKNEKIALTFVFGLALSACTGTPAPVAEIPPPPAPEPLPQASTLTGTYLAARFAAAEGELDGAAQYYSNLLGYDPGNGDLLARTFLYAASAGEMDIAVPLARQVVLQDPRNRPGHLLLAAEAMRMENYPLAEEEIQQAGGGAFFSLTNTLVQAWALAGSHRTEDALAILDQLSNQAGVAALHAFHKALILEYLGENEEAKEAYRQAVALPGIGSRGIDALGRFLRRTGRGDEAEEIYRDLETRLPDSPLGSMGLAEIDAGIVPEALVSTPSEGAAEGLFALASSLTGEDNSDIAILYLNVAIYMRPDFELARAFLGDRYERMGKYEKAIEVYSSVPADSVYSPMLEVQTALNLGRIGRTEEGVARLEAVVRRAPNDLEAWTALADLRLSIERYEGAIDAYDRAIRLTPDRDDRLVDLYFSRGITYQSLDRWNAAERDFQDALAIDDERADILNFLGYSWVDRGLNLDQAVTMLEKARSLRPLDGYIADSVGWAYYKLGRYEEAAEVLEQAVQLAPGASEINDHLGDAYWMIGRKLDAQFEWMHALNLDPGPEARPIIERKLRIGLARTTPTDS